MKSDTRRSSGRIAILAGTVAPGVALATMVALWGVDLAFWDQWALVPHLDAWAEGRLALADLWRQHNEHRLFFPQLLMVGLAALTEWNIRVELAVNVWLAAGILAVLAALVRRTIEAPPAWLLPLLSLLVFSPGQWENWAWGWQIQIFLNVLAVVATITLLAETPLAEASRPAHFLGAILCAVVASFSFANGLLVWGLGLPLVLRDPRSRWLRSGLWIGAGVAVFALYFHDLGFYDREPFFAEGVARTAKLFGGYVSIYLGAPLFGFDGHTAMYGGFVLLVATAAFGAVELRRHGLGWLVGPRLPWLLLAAYAAASALLTAYGRLHFGLGQALTARYVTLSSLFWIGVAGLLALAVTTGSETRQRWIRRLVLASLLPIAAQWVVGAGHLRAVGEERAAIREAILRDEPVDLGLVYPDPDVAAERIETLEELGLGPFRR